jgi:hypothetical protein
MFLRGIWQITDILFGLLVAAGGVAIAFAFSPLYGWIDLIVVIMSGAYLTGYRLITKKEESTSFLWQICGVLIGLNALATVGIFILLVFTWLGDAPYMGALIKAFMRRY